jgi:hypothetical protein
MPFKARKLKKGWFEVVGLEQYIEARIQQALGTAKKTGKKAAKTTSFATGSVVDDLVAVLNRHNKKSELIRAGKVHKDQLLRSLIPLYLGRNLELEVTSGHVSKFWSLYGVKYAAPNAAKVLREHVGFARNTRLGRQITPNGIKYVEAAMNGRPLKRAA